MAVYKEPKKYLRKSIESILNQTFKDFEFIIILDNPNNEKAEHIIKEYQAKDERIIFIKNEENLGLAGSLNKSIEIAKGKYIARMDADDISFPKRLEKQFKHMKDNSVDLLFSWVYFIDKKGDIIKEFKPSKEKVNNLKKYFFKEHLLVHPTLFCKSKILKNNFYDKNQKKSQDFELWIRLMKKDFKFDVIEEFLLKYRIPSKNLLEERIKKVRDYNFWTLKALKKNFKESKNLDSFYKFYIKKIFLYFFLKLPEKFIKYSIIIKDKFKNEFKI